MDDAKIILTPEEAEGLLLEGEHVHNFANPAAGMMLGCDYSRSDAITAFQQAVQIELGGENCMHIKHPIVVWDSETHFSFFEADMMKVKAFEAKNGQ